MYATQGIVILNPWKQHTNDSSLLRARSDCRPQLRSYSLHLLCSSLDDSRSFHFCLCCQILPPTMGFRCIIRTLPPQTSRSHLRIVIYCSRVTSLLLVPTRPEVPEENIKEKLICTHMSITKISDKLMSNIP